jgi:hypothetical protein
MNDIARYAPWLLPYVPLLLPALLLLPAHDNPAPEPIGPKSPVPPVGPGDEGECGPSSSITACWQLEEDWNYGYSSPEKAMCEFPGGTKRKPDPTTGGPCIGEGTHSNVVTANGGRLGSIVCCPCCEGPRLELRCGTQ